MKRQFKIVLDVVMLLMTLTLFSKRLISMKYHEIAGLVLIALILVHIAVNIRTVKAMCEKFIKVPAAIKAGLIVDILLLICFAFIGISGILISHTILTGISSDNIFFKLGHMFAGGLSVILLGVHIGLHICRKPMPVVAAVIVSAAVFGGGIYGVLNSSEGRWLSMPFTVTSQQGKVGANGGQASENNQKNMKNEANENGGSQNNGEKKQQGKANKQPMTLAQRLQNVIMFLGMILSCTMLTYWIAVPRKKKNIPQHTKKEE